MYPSNSYMFQPLIKPKHVAVSVFYIKYMPIPVAAISKSWVCGHSLAVIVGWKRAGVMDVCCVLSEVSPMGCSLAQRSPTECGVSECDREATIIKKPWLTEAVPPW
jgi:hypothetical protein